jgi:hypothetical protein
VFAGHTSWSFASMGFTSLYLFYFMIPGQRPTSYSYMGTIAFPLLLSAWIGATRIADYDHHPSDVVAGAFIGVACAYLMFGWRFPWTIRTYHARQFNAADRKWFEIDEAHTAEADIVGASMQHVVGGHLFSGSAPLQGQRPTLPHGREPSHAVNMTDNLSSQRDVANEPHEAVPPAPVIGLDQRTSDGDLAIASLDTSNGSPQRNHRGSLPVKTDNNTKCKRASEG